MTRPPLLLPILGFLALSTIFSKACANTAARDELVREFNVKAHAVLVIDADLGDIEIRPEGTSEIKVRVNREVHCATEKEGQEVLAKHIVTFDQRGDTITVKGKPTSGSRKKHWSSPMVQVHYVVVVPTQASLDLKTAGGKIAVGDLAGDIVAHTSAGDIAVGKFDGPVKLGTSAGSIDLKASGPADLVTGAGNIVVGRIGGVLHARTSGGAIQADAVTGAVEASSSAGDIRFGELGATLKAHTSAGGIQVQSVAGNASVDTSAGDIRIGSASGTLDAVTSAGQIEVERVAESADLKTSAGDIRLNEAGGSVHAHSSGGGIRLGRIKGLSPKIDLSTSSGDIVVSLTESARFDLDADASGGDISSEVPVTISSKGDGRMTGQILGNGPGKNEKPGGSLASLKLRTSGGRIEIRKN